MNSEMSSFTPDILNGNYTGVLPQGKVRPTSVTYKASMVIRLFKVEPLSALRPIYLTDVRFDYGSRYCLMSPSDVFFLQRGRRSKVSSKAPLFSIGYFGKAFFERIHRSICQLGLVTFKKIITDQKPMRTLKFLQRLISECITSINLHRIYEYSYL